ncbi:MAG: chloride channel protein [Akkermansiaceae bacterium]|nr:chloride channel protein [Akkermansiaceae bacterium]
MTNEEDQTAGKTRMSWSWLRMALNLREKIKLGDKQVIFIWAALVGALGALTALLFEMGVELVQDLLTGRHGYRQIQAFQEMASQDWAWCIFVPAAGGLLAGLTLLFTQRFVPAKATEYMEAVALGNGYVPPKPSLLRSLSAVFSIGSGASIGREGPLVQSAAVVGSALGRLFHLSAPRLRLVVACAAASGMSAAFHTPLAGGLFVSEIVLGALTIDFLAPLLVASCAGYFTMGLFHEPAPIYQLQQEVSLTGNQHVLWCVLLGCLASLLASLWLLVLKKSRQYLNGKRHWLPVRLMAAGMLVGVIAIFYPEIVGNGKNIITALIHYEFDTTKAAILLALKICTVAIVFGVGTVGGALTPSLTIGSVFGFLFSAALTQMGVPGEHAIAYSLVGMAAFFTTAANAPITSLVLVVEFTMAGQMMFPLIIGVLVSYGTARLTKAQSMYHDSLAFGPRSTFDKPLAQVQLQDVARKDPPVVHPLDKFGTIAAMLIKNPAHPIFVTSPAGKYLGSVEAEDVAAFARNKELAQAVLAMDVLRNDMPTLPADMHLPEALGIFSRPHCGESLALVNPDNDHLLGVVNKTDLYLVLSEIMRREKLQ